MPNFTHARIAVMAVFTTHGMVYASWLPHIPLIKDDLGLSEGQLGLLLLAPPVGAMLAMPLTGAACAKWGSGPVTRFGLIGYAVLIAVIGAGSGSATGLMLALFVAGVLVGVLDVAMNAQAAAVEQAMDKPVMNSFHALWSLGAAAGAVAGGVGAQLGIPLTLQLAALGLLCLAIALPTSHAFVGDIAPDDDQPRKKLRLERGLIGLAFVSFAALLAEGAAADWSAVYLSEALSANALVASMGYAMFACAMFGGRLAGDRFVARYGRTHALTTASLVGCGGMAIGLGGAALLDSGAMAQALAVGGLCVLGLGLAVIVPVVLSTAADGPGIATVSTGGYTGWLLGPAVIGGLGELLGLSAAMWFIPALALIAGLVAPGAIRSLRPAPIRAVVEAR